MGLGKLEVEMIWKGKAKRLIAEIELAPHLLGREATEQEKELVALLHDVEDIVFRYRDFGYADAICQLLGV
jgi:hypothetical protein